MVLPTSSLRTKPTLIIITTMDDVSRLIADFKAEDLPADELDEASIKVDVILDLADYEDERILPFYLNVLADLGEYDLARIEILKILELRDRDDDQEDQRIGEVIAKVLKEDPDFEVRQYAAMAAANYLDIPVVFESVRHAVEDSEEDLDVRINAMKALAETGSPEGREILEGVQGNAAVGRYAKGMLERWE